jgi:hypothetical protein
MAQFYQHILYIKLHGKALESFINVKLTVVNMGVQMALLHPESHCFDICPGVVLLDHMVVPFLVF